MATTERFAGKAFARASILIAAFVAVSVGLVWHPAYDAPIEYIGYALRVTARVSFAFFMLAYIARPLVDVLDTGRWLVRNRRYLGLAAAFAHTVHFGYVVAYLIASGEPLPIGTLVLGGGAFLFLWAMAATSNNASVRALGVWWKRLHRVGIHYLWIVFVYTFAGVALEVTWYWLFVGAGFTGLGLRVVAAFNRRDARLQRTARKERKERKERTG